MSQCYYIPVLVKNNQCKFLLCRNKITEEWMPLHTMVDPRDGGVYESVVRGVLETTHGTICNGEESLVFEGNLEGDLSSYFFVKTALSDDYSTYLTAMFVYNIKKKRVIHPDDFDYARWFTIDEVFSFKNVSSQLTQIVLENQNTFHNYLHSPVE